MVKRNKALECFLKAVVQQAQALHRPITKKDKLRIKCLEKQGGRCRWCGKKFNTQGKSGRRSVTLDHLLPRSQGGKLTENNVVAACKRCNNKRANQMVNPVTGEPILLANV